MLYRGEIMVKTVAIKDELHSKIVGIRDEIKRNTGIEMKISDVTDTALLFGLDNVLNHIDVKKIMIKETTNEL